MALSFSVQQCEQGTCESLQVVEKQLPVTIDAGQKAQFKENLDFKQLPEDQKSLSWAVTVDTVKAVK